MFIYYILITLASIAIVINSYFGGGMMNFLGDQPGSRFGDAAVILLWAILLAKPLMIIMHKFSEVKILKLGELQKYILNGERFSFTKCKKIFYTLLRAISGLFMKWRRLLGITVFILAFTHGGINVAMWIQTGYGFLAQRQSTMVLTGYISLLFLFVGYLTSNNFSIRFFKSKRKLIQKSAYLALIFVILHLVFLAPSEYRFELVLLIIYFYLKLVEKGKIPFFLKAPVLPQ